MASNEVKVDPDAGVSLWQPHLSQYRYQVAMGFISQEELSRAIYLCWHEDQLFGMPRAYPGRNSLIVPVSAVAFFRAKGLKFKERKVIHQRDLSAEEAAELRRERAKRKS